jgi:NIMA (never in mitosis gene a)-related kinase 8
MFLLICVKLFQMDNYEELEVLGRGAFGTVTLCKSRSEKERLVVLKEIEAQDTPEVTEAEVKVASSFSHPLIVRFFGQFSHHGNVFIIMEYMAGGTLWNFLGNRGSQLLSQNEVLHYFAQLVVALEHIHSKKVLHRDIKSKNILLSADFRVAKIGDFGISKVRFLL